MTRYRHGFHAGNFADVHKHVTLAALIESLKRKEKGFLYLETHAGRGAYDLGESIESRAAAAPIARVLDARGHPEIETYARAVVSWREHAANPLAYPGSPLLALELLRPQDRAVLIELVSLEASALKKQVAHRTRVMVVHGDGFERLRGYLPPIERRGITLIDPPYERPDELFKSGEALAQALERFPTGVVALWYPIKDERDTETWQRSVRIKLGRELLSSELWLHPCDSRVGLNGSGLLIANPPWQIAERMRAWLPALLALLATDPSGGTRIRLL